MEGEKQLPNRIVPVGVVVEKIHPEQNNLDTSNTYAALQGLDSEDDTVPETQLTAGDLMDMVTGSSDASQPTTQDRQDITERLLTAARDFSMNRQLRLERDGLHAAASNDTTCSDDVADSDSGEDFENVQPSLTLPQSNSTDLLSTPEKEEKLASASESGMGIQDMRTQIASELQKDTDMPDEPTAVDLHSVAVIEEADVQHSPTPSTHTDGAAATAAMADAAATARMPEAAASGAAEKLADETDMAHHKSHLAEKEDTATKEGLAKRSKSKRKAKAIPQTTRQLRSSKKPDALQALADKRTKMAPTHPKRSHLEDKLRAAVDLGMHPTAYVIDTGQSGALRAMDLVAKQQWDDLAHTEAFADSEDFSE